MQVYKYTVHGQNSHHEKPKIKKPRKHADCEHRGPFHVEMASNSVIGYCEVCVRRERKYRIFTVQTKNRLKTISHRNLGQCRQPCHSLLKNAAVFSEMINLI